MISAAHLWTVGYTVAAIALLACAAGAATLRVLAGRSVSTILTVIAAVTISATLAGVVVIAMEMLISQKDRDIVLAVVVTAGIAGFAVALLVGRRLSAASRLLNDAVRDVAAGGEYRPPDTVLPSELAALSSELELPTGGWPTPGTASAHWKLAGATSSRGSVMICARRSLACVPWRRRSKTASSAMVRQSGGITPRSAGKPIA